MQFNSFIYKTKTYVFNKYLCLLLLINLISNYFFIFQYKFYSDDWEQIVGQLYFNYPFPNLILENQRPFLWVFFYIEKLLFNNNYLPYHIVSLMEASIIIVLLYYITKYILNQYGYKNNAYPFVTVLIYIILFNKDQIYPWASIAANDFAMILYLLCFYIYMCRSKWYHIYVCLLLFFVAISTYEIGITLPAILFAFDYMNKRNYKASLLFVIPLGVSFAIRVTNWFGYGHSFDPKGIVISLNIINIFIFQVLVFFKNIVYAVIGLFHIDTLSIIVITVTTIATLILVYLKVPFKNIDKIKNKKFILFVVIMLMFFTIPIILRGGYDKRFAYLVDFSYAILLMILVSYIASKKYCKIILLVLVGISIILCQGLYSNWVVSGNIQEAINQHISANAKEISSYEYVYFNSTSFKLNIPNDNKYADNGWLYNKYILRNATKYETTSEIFEMSHIKSYDKYYNSRCMNTFVLDLMIKTNMKTIDQKIIIFGELDNDNILINEGFNNITYKNATTGEIFNLNSSEYYEINYNKVNISNQQLIAKIF